jgi:uncharacterized protein (TIGR04255 family)
MPVADEWLYSNAPLIEVIAEIRWALQPLGALPGAAVDPHFEITSQELTGAAKALGFATIETLVPPEVPREFLAYQPILRFRKRAGLWPLFQIGPGVFSVNIVPPYDGWSSFKPTLEGAVDAFLKSYPAANKLLKITNISLRYMDAFTVEHGRRKPAEFLKAGLGITVGMPDVVRQKLSLQDEPESVSLEMAYRLPMGASLHIKALQGSRDNTPATMVELICFPDGSSVKNETPDLMRWFDDAHAVLSDAFETLATDDLKNKMGPRTKVN